MPFQVLPAHPVLDTSILVIDQLNPSKRFRVELGSLDPDETAILTLLGSITLPDTGGALILPVVDTTPIVKGSADAGKLVRFEVDGFAAPVTRVITPPDKDITLDDITDTRTPVAHKTSHQNGGGDEISVASLSGLLADAQKVAVEDDGVAKGTRSTLNFTGGGVTVTDDAGNDEIDIDIPLVDGDATKTPVPQTAHGFSVGDPVRNNGTDYELAKSDTVANVEAFGMVSAVADVDNFTITTAGFVDGLVGLTKGAVHFISVTGTLTTTEPTISKAVFFADSTTSGFWINMRGFETGVAGGGGIWEKTQSESISSSTASVDLDLDGTSKLWMITITGATPVSNEVGNNFDARVLVGGVVDTGTVYRDVAERTAGASYSGQGSQGRAFMSWVPGVGGDAGESMMLSILVANPNSTTDDKLFSGQGSYIHNDGGCRKNTFSSSFNTQASAIDGVRMFFETSNIAKAEIIVHKMLEF